MAKIVHPTADDVTFAREIAIEGLANCDGFLLITFNSNRKPSVFHVLRSASEWEKTLEVIAQHSECTTKMLQKL